MNNNLIFLGLLFILATNGTINSTQLLLLLALLTTTSSNNWLGCCNQPFNTASGSNFTNGNLN